MQHLKNMMGHFFFVSHDRTFVNLVTTEILEVNNGNVLKYPGSYEDYVYYMEKNVREEHLQETEVKKPEEKKKGAYHLKKELKKERRELLAIFQEY